ncbi:MAG: NFACT RNA binding domain-containing protein [Bacteroidota bacterium]|nr:NFACT RNA binding domain-containing protein [Bacteroidota bacterium]
MYKNYFYLNRMVLELNSFLPGTTLKEAFSQEKDKLNLCFTSVEENVFNLIVSASQNEPYILLKKEFHRAKKNSIGFFQEFLPSKLINVEIATDDRIIKFNFAKFTLFFLIHGKDSNVVLTENMRDLVPFKKITEETEKRTLSTINEKLFSPFLHEPYLSDLVGSDNLAKEIKNRFPFISKEILSEVSARTKDNTDPEEYISILSKVINEIHNTDISVFYEKQINKVVFAPSTFRIFDRQDNRNFETYLNALNEYLISKYRYEKLIQLRSRITKYLEPQINKLAQKLNQIKFKLDSPSKEELYRHYGNLLLANIHLLYKGMKDITVDDYMTDQPVKIPLNETFETKKNIDAYFEKAKDEKQSRISLKDLFDNISVRYNNLLMVKNKFESATKLDEYIEIMKKLNLSDETPSNSQKYEREYNFKHYIVENKYHVFVGKDSQNNDLLTVKFAKQNDFWFHARGVPGSHVVLRVENTKEAIPKPIIKKAASLAAYHSKAKTSKMAPVAYTLKKYVIKKKGMEPGKVIMQKEDVILVPPEIPEGCEFQTD